MQRKKCMLASHPEARDYLEWALLATTVILGALLYKLLLPGRRDFWKKLGIREIDTSPAVSTLDIFLARKPFTAADDYIFSKLGPSEKFCGFRQLGKPILLVKDLDLMKKILIKDFDYFVDRRNFFTKEDGSLNQMLPSLQGDEWKGVRSSISPTFTTGKIRRMMECFNTVGHQWVNNLRKKATTSETPGSTVIDVLTVANQYTVEVISTTVFGMNINCIENPSTTFFQTANKVVSFRKRQMFKMAFRFLFPRLNRLLGLSIMDKSSLQYFEQILEQGLKSRLRGENQRNDFLQLLVEAHKGELKAAGADELSSFEKEAQLSTEDLSKKKQYLTEDVMNAQSVVFFFAGFSTTSNFISFAMYALALHPDVQDRLRKEVAHIVKEDGSVDYDDVGGLSYMDMVVCEVLRKFPAVARLERICVREYRDPDIGLVVPKGTTVSIPLSSIHSSKEHYHNPDGFDPEHFSAERKASRNAYGFMPFGMGPRNCIGMRFALTEVKSAIAHMVHNFRLEPTSKTPVPLQGKPAGLQFVPPENLELKLTPITPAK